MAYNLSDEGAASFSVGLDISSAQGVRLFVVCNVAIIPRAAYLVDNLAGTLRMQVEQGSIKTSTMTVTNRGNAPSGPISVVLPNPAGSRALLYLGSPNPIPSLEPEATTTVVVNAVALPNTALQRLEGDLALLDSEGYLLLKQAVRLTVVSDNFVSFAVLVEDEFSYFDAENNYPKLAGASVRLTNNDGFRLELVSGANGLANFTDIRAGVYSLTTQSLGHAPDSTTVVVSEDMEKVIQVFLPRSVVSYTWTVVPTPIREQYDFELEATFETYVPMPVVTIEPAVLDLQSIELTLRAGSEFFQIDFVLTNHGLIAAQAPTLDVGLGVGLGKEEAESTTQ